MKIRGLTIQEIKDNYYWRNRFDCGNSLTGTILGTILLLFGCACLLLVLWTQAHWIVAIIITPLFTFYAIREQWRGLLWVQRTWKISTGNGWTDKPRVLFRKELQRPRICGTKIGCDWGVDIDGKKYKKK